MIVWTATYRILHTQRPCRVDVCILYTAKGKACRYHVAPLPASRHRPRTLESLVRGIGGGRRRHVATASRCVGLARQHPTAAEQTTPTPAQQAPTTALASATIAAAQAATAAKGHCDAKATGAQPTAGRSTTTTSTTSGARPATAACGQRLRRLRTTGLSKGRR